MPGIFGMMTGGMDPNANMYKPPAQGAGNPFMIPQMPSPETIAELQRQYGVQFPQHMRQNVFMPEAGTSGFWGQHPRLARGVEGAAIGAMETPPSSGFEGAGQGVSRALQGMFGVPQMHRAFQSAQIQAPFAQAEQIGGLREAAEQLQTMKALQEFYSGKNRSAEAIAAAREEGAVERAQLQSQLKQAQETPMNRWMNIEPQGQTPAQQAQWMERFFQAQQEPKTQGALDVANARGAMQAELLGERLGQQAAEFNTKQAQQKAEFDQTFQRQAEMSYQTALKMYNAMKLQSNYGIPLDPAAEAQYQAQFPPPKPEDFGIVQNATPMPGMQQTTPKGKPGPGAGQGAAAPQGGQAGPANQDPLNILGH